MHKGLQRSSPRDTGNWEGLLQAQLFLQLGVRHGVIHFSFLSLTFSISNMMG